MATDIEYINYKEFVGGLSDAETPDENDKAVVCNETDGPRATPLNAKALTTTADETDLNENSSIDIYTANGRKRLPGNAIAKASDVSALQTKTTNISASIAPDFDPTRTEDKQYLAGEKVMYGGSLFEFDQPHYGAWTGTDAHKVDLVDLDVFGSFIEKFCDFNLFNKNAAGVALGTYLNANGIPSESDSYNTSEFIKIRGNSSIKSSATMHAVCFYDSNKNFISGSRSTGVTEITSPSSAVYVRFDAATNAWDAFVLSTQTNYPTEYMPYGRVKLKNTVDFDYNSSKLIGAMSSQQCDFFEFNLFNISDEDVALGKYLSSGSLVDGDYNTSGYIPIIKGMQYLSNKNLRFVNFFDSQKNYLSALTNIASETPIDVPSGARYARFSCTPTNWAASLMFSTVDCMPSSYMVYGQIKFKEVLVTEKLKFSDIGGFVNFGQCDFFEFNLFNISDEDVALGKYINVNNGNLSSNSSYNTSGWISCDVAKKYKSNKNIAFIGYYDENKTFISAASAIVVGTELTPPTDALYLRVTYATTYWGDSTVFSTTANFPSGALEYGVVRLRPSYIPTSKTYIPPKVGAFFSSDSALAVDTNLSVGSYNITKNILIVAEFVGTIETVAVGVSYYGYYGCWVEITPTSVVVKRGSSATTVETLTHGLTLDGYLNVAIDNVINSDGTESAVIRMSNEHQQVYSHSISLGHPQGAIFLRNKNVSGTLDCKLSFMPKDADRPVWIFGDSYCSYDSSSRWLYYVMRDMKFLNFLLAARGGESSASAIIDFRALVGNHAKFPSFAVWCMGMNNGNDGDGVPNSGWLSDTQEFLTTCDLFGITPILMTIPTVPEHSHVYMNNWIRNSGRRYIDAAKAVEVAGTDTWKFYGDTEAFLSSDLVHPTTYGAKAIAAQVILDFPELSVM